MQLCKISEGPVYLSDLCFTFLHLLIFASTLSWLHLSVEGAQNPFCSLIMLALPALSIGVPPNGRRYARRERRLQ